MRITITLLLQVAGVLHLGRMCGGLLMPKVVRMRRHLATLPTFIRQLFWVYYSFIALCLGSFCVISTFFAGALADGSVLARVVCMFLAVFWTLRLAVATFVFDMEPYLTGRLRRAGYAAMNVVFAYLPVVYTMAALQPRWLR